jgi:class 3 adenylate cyclase/tetratricopeptide (TPR) repeat protein
MTDIVCASCSTPNEAGRKFCGECGASLAVACPACGSPNGPGVKFCGECGTALQAAAPAAARVAPSAERRLVSVLFADLVGFTTLAEGRDAEDTRELLTRYFDVSRTVIERYGGTVEKFIGDAVMAVWGTPVAQEDDAERAVRAALDLVDGVVGLAADVGAPELAARVGVMTGEAAVTLGAEGQGMVAGDLVNTAARIQSAADPGAVLVGDASRRAAEAAIGFEDVGDHALKGKGEPVRLWRALGVMAQRGGGGRAAGLEAPFVGRATELRLVKELFHACADESRARLVSVVGVAGIGKSRLSWEFEKYVDGLAADVWWHRGRCLSYGDGVAYWALAEMVRGRAGVLEDEDAASALVKARAMLETHLPDADERAWVEPRLLHLLGLADRTASDREDLFSAWRRFFERLAEQGPLVMVFEDLHWADEGLVAFVEYLLDWSRHHPIFVLALSRPEVADRHPGFPGATRSATTLPLDPLAAEAMDELLLGLVPDLPDDTRTRLRDAADGIPLYAVETVRMLRDRGLLTETGLEGDLTALEVPETLHALIASRLDALDERERRLLQDASVLGKTFTKQGLGALSGLDAVAVDGLVAGLVRKELLAAETDPFSAERGQYGFLQALVQRVTYETIARRDRRDRHLAVARYLSEGAGIDADEIAEVIASHYLDAHETDPDAHDRDDIRAEARRWFTRAAERAASLAASLEAQRAYERAAGLADDEIERGRSLARAGKLATMGARFDEAEPLLREAIAILEAAGARADAADAENALGEILFGTERLGEAIEQLGSALTTYEAEGDEVAIATASAQLGRFLLFAGRHEEALARVERSLELAERLELGEVVVQALINKGITLKQRPQESVGLMRQALVLAEEIGDWGGAMRACMNLGYLLSLGGREHEAMPATEHGLALARRRGDRVWERSLAANLCGGYVMTGRWDEAERLAAELPDTGATLDPVHSALPEALARIALFRGDEERAIELLAPAAEFGASTRVQTEVQGVLARALIAIAEHRYAAAVTECVTALQDRRIGAVSSYADEIAEIGGEAAWSARSVEGLATILELGSDANRARTALGEAMVSLTAARLGVLRGDPAPPFADAEVKVRAFGAPFSIGSVLLDRAEWLTEQGRADEAAADATEAREIFERLRATPMLERLDRLDAAMPTVAS